MLTGGQIWCRFYQLNKVSVPDMIYFVDASDDTFVFYWFFQVRA